ncbi:hypothetical protein J3R82DRAFT_5727 [Butyriboletus roseoflavus]|nr:hypothetical protein J3R82DRAFT_5727 [Butyriboletus roseoflavus]
MAQVAHEQAPRISQVLPTVKCSSCGQPVPLAALGEHVCPPLPPPSMLSLHRPSMSPLTTAPLLPQRLQPLVAKSETPPHKSSSEKPSEAGERVLAPSRDPFHRLPPDKSKMATPKATNVPLPRTSPASFDPDRPQRLPGAPTPPPERVSTPARDAIPPALQRVRTTSNASRPTPPARDPFPIQFAESPAHPAPARPAALSPARGDNLSPTHQPLAPPPSSFTIRASSNPMPPSSIHHHPSFERAPTSSTVSTLHPSLDKSRPSLDKLRPSLDTRLGSQHPLTEQNSSPPPGALFPRPSRTTVPAPAPGDVPLPSSAPPTSARQPPPPPLSLVYSRAHGTHREIDTKIGGEAGMAGVGRRGFAAAARAAVFTTSRSPSHQPPPVATLGDRHRTNVPQYLDTNATILAALTPPLSPNSAQTLSPVSPFPVSPDSLGSSTSTNGLYPHPPSPHDAKQSPVSASNDKAHPLLFSPGVRIASPSRSPSPIPNPFERRLSGETISQSPMPNPRMPLPFLDVLNPALDPENESDDESVYTTHTDPKKDEALSSPSADSDVGLAYAHDSDDETPVKPPETNRVKFPTCTIPDTKHPPGPSRQISVPSLRSAISAHPAATSFAGPSRARSASAGTQSTAKSVGALERAMETLIEEGASVSVLASGSVLASIGGSAPGRGPGKPSRSNTVPGPASPEQKPPKLPTRSHTSPSHPHVHSERVSLTGEVARIRNRGPAKRKNRMCVGCDSRIEDGRWIQMDGGNVLCERCWKNMYLPKCRRCNLPIEKQAVSSRDGQLKGKYHKECFSCHACQKPFPDKEFYVLDGKPFCAYHYHEANNSLCGAPSCGQPIEGPCAVTHSGKRYHPEHLLCEFEDGCKERLEEYWEVEGQMLCERHATFITRGHDLTSGTQVRRARGTDEGKMMKRMTRFIDLGAGGDDELDIR